ncbi:MAG: hypothetical protein RLY86_124 [Pseudomonadota bacterium]|jgi:phage tail P2-like protein
MNSLLPPNATSLEKALDLTVSRLSDVDVPVRDLWSPDRCPPQVLPWLAWALSVDAWDEAWPEQVQREALRSAWYTHAHKGTRGAVLAALAPYGLRCDVVEWWQHGGAPHTYALRAEVLPPPVHRPASAAAQAGLLATLARVAPARSHLTGLTLSASYGARTGSGLAVAAAGTSAAAGALTGRRRLPSRVALSGVGSAGPTSATAGPLRGRARLVQPAGTATVGAQAQGSSARGPVTSRRALAMDGATAGVLAAVPGTAPRGALAGRARLAAAGVVGAAMGIGHTVIVTMQEEPVRSIYLRGGDGQEVELTIRGGQVVAIAADGTVTPLGGRPRPPSIVTLGVVTLTPGDTVASPVAGDVVVGDQLIIATRSHRVTAVGAGTVTFDPPYPDDAAELVVLRLRNMP